METKKNIEGIISTANELIEAGATIADPKFKAWKTRTISFLEEQCGKDSVRYQEFKKRMYDMPRAAGLDGKNVILLDEMKTTILEFQDYLKEIEEDGETMAVTDFSKVFIVHGHDSALRESVARIIEKQDIEAIILNEQANRGRTIIEKLENNTDVGAAVVLLTCDDIGKAKDEHNENPRARQNVLFECGYLMGKLGRDKVIVIVEDGVDIPSDLKGLVYSTKDDWKTDLLRELKEIGFSVDAGKLL